MMTFIKKILFNLHALFCMLLFMVNVIIFAPIYIILGFFKLIVPLEGYRSFLTRILDVVSEAWISVNNANIRLTMDLDVQTSGFDRLKRKEWYLVLSNHQSWVDIVILQKVFNKKIPMLKFFLKMELLWVPLLNVAWWALDFPFMKRYSSEYIKKYPHKKGKDIEITRKACEKFNNKPVSIMNFVEGHRFTPEHHASQKSPFANLLRPKAGGIAFVLSAMGKQLHKILNVTIVYPEGDAGFWSFLGGKIKHVIVNVEEVEIPREKLGDYMNDDEYRDKFQDTLNNYWEEKDRLITTLKRKFESEHG